MIPNKPLGWYGAGRAGLSKVAWRHRDLPNILAVVLVLATAVRLGSALYQGDSVSALPGIHDQISYDLLARQVLAGHGFTFPTDWWPATRAGEPTAHWSYLYTSYLATIYGIVGAHPLVARLIQAVVAGVLHPLLAWRIGRRLFGVPVGLTAAALTAFYPYFVYYAGALMTETFYILAVLWVLDLTTSAFAGHAVHETWRQPESRLARPRPWPGLWLLLGLAAGCAALLRQTFLFFLPFLLIWILWSIAKRKAPGTPLFTADRLRAGAIRFSCSLLVLCVLIAPWTVLNFQSFHRFILLNTNAGYAFFWANHPVHGTNFVSVLPGDTYRDLIPGDVRGLDEAALDQALLWRGVRFVIDDPPRYAMLSLSRIDDYFSFLPTQESSPISNLSRVASFGILLPFMIGGLALSIVSHRWRALCGQSPMVTLLYVFVAVYSLIHILSWALIRYRLPVDAVLIQFAALAIVWLVAGWPVNLLSGARRTEGVTGQRWG